MDKERQPVFKIKYCPCCGESLENRRSLLNEFWEGNDTSYFCWCSHCSWRGEVTEIMRVTAPELA